MRVDAHVTSGTTQALLFSIWYMLLGLGIPVLLGHTKVNDIYHVLFAGCTTDEEVIRLDISVDEIFFVERLNSRDLP